MISYSASQQKHTLQFHAPAKTSRDTLRTKDTWFLRLWSNDNPEIIGIGECSTIWGLSIESEEGFEDKLNEVCSNPNLFLKDPSLLKNFPAIQFGLEMAAIDLRQGGLRILFPSGFTHKQVPISINGLVWMGDEEFMMKQMQEKIALGFSCIKIKIGSIDFEEEIRILEWIRKRYTSEDIEIRVDANGAFSSKNALAFLERLAHYDLHSIEQPIRQGQWKEMAELCKESPLDIALDEELIGIRDLDERIELLDTIKPQYIILKPSLLGGFEQCEGWINLAKERNCKWWITSALESNIGLNAIAQWTATLNNPMPQGLGTGGLYSNNIKSPLLIHNGHLIYDPSKGWMI